MHFASIEAEQRYADVVRAADRVVVGLDFDGTLAPIVEDPTKAHIHPDAQDALIALAPRVAGIAVITGRPARQVLDLGGLEEVADAIVPTGRSLHIFGQYGHEHWSSEHRRILSPRPPRGLSTFERELPRVLRKADAADAYVEDKGLAVAVHTRRLADPEEAFQRLLVPISRLATDNGLVVEPGRQVIEARSAGAHKGMAVHQLAADFAAAGFVFAGDDLGDLEAFDALDDLAKERRATLRVCSASSEESALLPRADVVVRGPDGVVEFLHRLAADAADAAS